MSEDWSTRQEVKISINGVDVLVPKGELIVESVKRLGLEIPVFCYHPRMKPVGMCRMCLVDVGFKQADGSVRMMPKPQAGCTLPADENMVIFTDSEQVRKDRKGVLEFLLINHPLDCPICDRGGECPLQNNTLFYGPSTSRFSEIKRHLPKAFPLSKYVTLDLERCIQCGRCVRFTEEISGDSQLAFLFRGAQMQPHTFGLTDFDSKFSGNVIEICPVGALTSREYRFRARPWDLETKPLICTECSNGCNIWFDYRAGEMVRINGRVNDSINEEWTCDKGKFGHNYLNSVERHKTPLVREDNFIRSSNWSKAYECILSNRKNKTWAGLTSGIASNEDYFMWKRLLTACFNSNDIDYRWTKFLPKRSEFIEETHGLTLVNSSIQSLEQENAIVIFGGDLADTQPIVFLRVRKAAKLFGRKVILFTNGPSECEEFADLCVKIETGAEVTALDSAIQDPAILTFLKDGFAVVGSRNLYDLSNGKEVAYKLANLCAKHGGKLNLYALKANSEGAGRLGLGHSKNTQEILENCANGYINCLWLFKCNPFELWHDRDLVQSALEKLDFLVVQNVSKTDCDEYANVILPVTAHTEQDGSYTNCESRVQWVDAVLRPKGNAKEGWRVFTELLLRAEGARPSFSAKEILSEIIGTIADFSKIEIENLKTNGSLLEPPKLEAKV